MAIGLDPAGAAAWLCSLAATIAAICCGVSCSLGRGRRFWGRARLAPAAFSLGLGSNSIRSCSTFRLFIACRKPAAPFSSSLLWRGSGDSSTENTVSDERARDIGGFACSGCTPSALISIDISLCTMCEDPKSVRNSSYDTCPSPSVSSMPNISSSSVSCGSSFRQTRRYRSSDTPMKPLPSKSISLNAWRISSSWKPDTAE
mmetsp:Transcript_53154/g.149773  ORF Transcript_53154/g.149773 Transcript_53154/m.149773 type:complete len:202 (+) Transcript_53154:288-893(+)